MNNINKQEASRRLRMWGCLGLRQKIQYWRCENCGGGWRKCKDIMQETGFAAFICKKVLKKINLK